jgi:hypothetical protein
MKKLINPLQQVESKIIIIRNKKVMLDHDLADLYGVETKRLKEQVKRNIGRFPADFMFTLSDQEFGDWRSQFATSNSALKMGLRHSPYAFTEQGIAMLSSVLNSEQAIHVNIQIIRTFTKLREMLLSNEMLRNKIETMEKKYDHKFKIVFDAIKTILEMPEPEGGHGKSEKIGFMVE